MVETGTMAALILGSSLLTTFVNQFFNIRKTRAEAKKISTDSDSSLSGATMEYARLLQGELKTLKTELVATHTRAVKLEEELTSATRRADELSDKVKALEAKTGQETAALVAALKKIVELKAALKEKDPTHPLVLTTL